MIEQIDLQQLQIKLLGQKEGMVKYLLLKVDKEDWHGVADAAMDIREIEAKLSTLKIIE